MRTLFDRYFLLNNKVYLRLCINVAWHFTGYNLTRIIYGALLRQYFLNIKTGLIEIYIYPNIVHICITLDTNSSSMKYVNNDIVPKYWHFDMYRLGYVNLLWESKLICIHKTECWNLSYNLISCNSVLKFAYSEVLFSRLLICNAPDL